jgi:hypothetical protein
MTMLAIETLLSDLDQNTDALIEHIVNFDPSFFDKLPIDESWSAAQLTEHLYVSDKIIFNILSGETEPAHRMADEKLLAIESVMQNRDRNLVAPDEIVPLGRVKDQQLLIEKLITVRKDIHRLIQTADLSVICLGFTHKGFGPMTRLEWIVFMMAHAQRHFHQFQKIAHTLHNIS